MDQGPSFEPTGMSVGLRDLTSAMRELHDRAGRPAGGAIMKALHSRSDWPGRFPEDFASFVLYGRGVAPWAKMEVLVRQLAEWSSDKDVEGTIERVHAIWLTADFAEFLGRTNSDPKTLEHTLNVKDLTSPVLGRAILEIARGPDSGRQWVLEGELTFIGRNYECDVRLDKPAVSRQHAVISRNGAIFTIRDVGSTNGTFLNKTRLMPDRDEYLEHEDQLGIGEYTLFFLTHQTLRP